MANHQVRTYSLRQQQLMLMADGKARCRNEVAEEVGSRTEWVCRSTARLLEAGHVRVIGQKKSWVTGGEGQALGLTDAGYKEAARLLNIEK